MNRKGWINDVLLQFHSQPSEHGGLLYSPISTRWQSDRQLDIQSPRAMQSHSTLPSRSWVWPGVLLEEGLLLNFRSCSFYVGGKVRGVIVIAGVRTAFPGRSRVFSWSPRVFGCVRKSVYSVGWCNPNTWDCDFVGSVRESRRECQLLKPDLYCGFVCLDLCLQRRCPFLSYLGPKQLCHI